jgi:nitrogen regulatory protein P-II 1
MKLVTAIIKPGQLDTVLDAVRGTGVLGITATEVKGHGRQGGHTEVYRGAEYVVDLVPKVRVEIICDVFDAERIADLIADAAKTGRIGDGKIWINEVDEVLRIRTHERGTDAL